MTRIAIVQIAPVFLDREATLDKAVVALAEVARAGARLIVFPEAFVPGYPAWLWRLRPGTDVALTEQLHARLRANAVDLNAGDSVVVAPGGKMVAGPLREALGILYAEIDLERVGIARRSLDVVGHSARPDIFQLQVNRRTQRPVVDA